MREGLAAGGSAAVFLRRPAVRGTLDSQPVKVDGIRLAAQVQSDLEEPVLALPTVFLWGEHAMKRLPGTMDFIFGSREYPRLLRSVRLLLSRRSIHKLTVGEPLDLLAIQKERGVSEDALTGVVRAGVGRQIEKIRRSRLGALTKPSSRIKTEVLGSPRLQSELERIAADEGLSKKEIASKSAAIIRKLAADFHPRVISLAGMVIAFIWKRIYTGIEIAAEDIEKMRSVMTKGPTLILPTHKSHIDYLVISQVMQANNIVLPHIAAGQNLSFWPLGWIFRSSGAFFIRRKFIQDRFYIAVVNAYLRRLIQQRYTIEVFIEGGRSRTGKLLRPQLGMLEMTLKALITTPRLDLQIIPAFIGYERVIEEHSYVNESKGFAKEAESIKGLLKSTKVLLSRYGQLHLRVGDPFSVDEILATLNFTRDALTRASSRREVALEMSLKNFREINRITVVTPSAVLATVLLIQREARLNHDDLHSLALWFVDVLDGLGATISSFVDKWREQGSDNRNGENLLDQTIQSFVKGGQISVDKKTEEPVYTIREGQRLPLDYYKNNIIHFFVPISMVCTSCLTADTKEVERSRIVEDVTLASRLYRWEFMLFSGQRREEERCREEVTELLDKALELLVRINVLSKTGNRFEVVDRNKAVALSDILLNFHEIYFAAVSTIRERAIEQGSQNSIERALAITQELTTSGYFSRPEGHSKLNLQNAIQVFKEFKILRPGKGQTPFENDGIGNRIYKYLEDATSINKD
ncbi:MAG: hypothetical protein GY847_12740 [Proteobacteria bacterium]|nr:hypothetical protein [Pseudomonadota bacterium]